MARISYDEQTAAAYKAVREVPRAGLSEWREAVRRHLRPSRGMTLLDVGAGELESRIIKEGLQDPQGLERHANVAIRLTHDCKST